EGHAEGEQVGRQPVGIEAEDEAERRSQRRHLRQREVDEEDAPPDDVEPEVSMDAGEDQGRQRREAEEGQRQDLAHGVLPPATRCSTSVTWARYEPAAGVSHDGGAIATRIPPSRTRNLPASPEK